MSGLRYPDPAEQQRRLDAWHRAMEAESVPLREEAARLISAAEAEGPEAREARLSVLYRRHVFAPVPVDAETPA